jgi:tetratricopeptide (TPR) repeat protein
MESDRELDSAGAPSQWCAVALCTILLVAGAPPTIAQSSSPRNAQEIPRLFEAEQWREIAELDPPLDRSAETDLQYGIALAHLQRWDDAERALEAGLRLDPRDPKLMVELAGVAFKQAQYSRAEQWMQRAVNNGSEDQYNFEFLATCYYLQGNLEAALKYWNRIDKPLIAGIDEEPRPKLDPVLLDRAFTFSPAGVLEFPALRTTQARINALGTFSNYRFDIEARPDGRFGLVFHNTERRGCAGNSWQCLLVVLGQTPAQTVNFSYFDIGNRAINVTAGFRWDGEKRREQASIAFPIANNPKWLLRVGTDFRNENWALRNSFAGPAPLLGAFNLKRESVVAQFTDVMSGRWQWATSTEVSRRQYHNVFAGVAPPESLDPGFELAQSFGVSGNVLSLPERRLKLDGGGSVTVAKLWSPPQRNFAQIQSFARLSWFPQSEGRRYELQGVFRTGASVGSVPFDQLFVLGVLGDTDLYMRAHIATRDGKKGSAPIGSNYFLSNWEFTRNVSPVPIAQIKIGPFVNTGKILGSSSVGSTKWLWDAGLEARLQAFGVSVTLSYARDLRAGKNAWVATAP